MTMRRRKPTEPPPIQIALARTGENNSNIVFLSFLMAIRLPSFSGVTLYDGPACIYGGVPPTTGGFCELNSGAATRLRRRLLSDSPAQPFTGPRAQNFFHRARLLSPVENFNPGSIAR